MFKYFSRNMQYIHRYKKTFLLKHWFRNYINYFIIDFLNLLFIDPIDNSKYKIGIEDVTYWVETFKTSEKKKDADQKSYLNFKFLNVLCTKNLYWILLCPKKSHFWSHNQIKLYDY